MKPSAEGSSPQPLPPDKPPWVVGKEADSQPINLAQANREYGTGQGPQMGEMGDHIGGNQKEAAEEVGSDHQSSPRERRYARYSARRGGGVRVPMVGGARREKKKVSVEFGLTPVIGDSTGTMEVEPSASQPTWKPKDSQVLESEGDKERELATNPGNIQNANKETNQGNTSKFIHVNRAKSTKDQAKQVGSTAKAMGATGKGMDKSKSVRTQPKGNKKQGGFHFSRAVNGGREVDMDPSRVLPEPILEFSPRIDLAPSNLSEYRKSVIMGYINGTAAVPNMVANAWSLKEWSYFQNQCTRMGFEPEYLVVDDESFMEDNLLHVKKYPTSPQSLKIKCQGCQAAGVVVWLLVQGFFSILLQLPPWVLICFCPVVAPFLAFGGAWPLWVFARFYRGWCYLMWKGVGEVDAPDQPDRKWAVKSFVVSRVPNSIFCFGEEAGCWEAWEETKTHPLHYGPKKDSTWAADRYGRGLMNGGFQQSLGWVEVTWTICRLGFLWAYSKADGNWWATSIMGTFRVYCTGFGCWLGWTMVRGWIAVLDGWLSGPVLLLCAVVLPLFPASLAFPAAALAWPAMVYGHCLACCGPICYAAAPGRPAVPMVIAFQLFVARPPTWATWMSMYLGWGFGLWSFWRMVWQLVACGLWAALFVYDRNATYKPEVTMVYSIRTKKGNM
ncbi:hypothetical protein E3N88_17903 [Mikania micrantha]|uniref:Uncharacterized protein n=1 Tax=Mikania micrantha TaxID=192012 RepID=A0A5N6NW80_9ASTR|nr:hypothetical protein E3N88_17903 [Mikania micrantha]